MNYKVLNTYEADVETGENPYGFKQQQLFDMALRINEKRRFLFVSQVLGKHLAVEPAIPLLIGHLLAYRFNDIRFNKKDSFASEVAEAVQTKRNLQEIVAKSQSEKINILPTTVIGFAETATALGHGFFEKLAGDIHYVHTTREDLVDVEPVICFEEEHSHATSHRVYADESIFLRETEIILVDDEMTTGKTNGNIIRQLHKKYPHLTSFTLVSILDFRTKEARHFMDTLAKELNITIHAVSLFTGQFKIKETGELFKETLDETPHVVQPISLNNVESLVETSLVSRRSYSSNNSVENANYYEYSGRFKLTANDQQKIKEDSKKIASHLNELRSDGQCLVLGTGEFMYMPLTIANYMGGAVKFHATTRSPIYADEQSLIYNKFTFKSAELPGITNFLYNIPLNTYSDIFVIYERVMDIEAAEDLFARLTPYTSNLHFVTLGGVALELYTR